MHLTNMEVESGVEPRRGRWGGALGRSLIASELNSSSTGLSVSALAEEVAIDR